MDYKLDLEESKKLLASYEAEIENQQKNLNAIISLASLVRSHIKFMENVESCPE